MQRWTEGRLSRISAWEQTIMPSSEWTISSLCMLISLAVSSSSPMWCFIVPARCVCIPLLLSKYKYHPLFTKTLSWAFHYPACVQPSSIHQQWPCSTQGPPSSAHHPQPALWHNAVVAFRLFMLAVVWGRLKTLCMCQALSWVAGRNLLGCEQRDRNAHMNGLVCAGHLLMEERLPLWVLVHQRNHLVQLHVQLGVVFPVAIHAE